jgi:transcriptional regulator with XRE-family HTH domain
MRSKKIDTQRVTIWPLLRNKIRQRKEFHKLTDEQLAYIAGVKRPNIGMFLTGKSKLGTDPLLRLASFLEFDPRDFIDWEHLE